MTNQVAENLLKREFIEHGARRVTITEIITQKYGWSKSFQTKLPIDAEGKPAPWYTYPAIEFLGQLDFTNKTVLEYGSGNSSLYLVM